MNDGEPARLPRDVVLFFAHPDDEFAVFPWIERLHQSGGRVCCLWLTDGGGGGQDPHVRMEESRQVLGNMGVAAEDMQFVGYEWQVPDGEMDQHMARIQARLEALAPRFDRFEEVWMPAWEGGHPDHDATHLLAHRFATMIGATPFQFSLYHGQGLPGPWFRVLAPLASNGPCRTLVTTVRERWRSVRSCLSYRSQLKSFVGLLPFYILRLLSSRAFVLQPVDMARTKAPPHAGRLLYERRGGPSWATFAARTRSYRAADDPAG